MDMLSEPPFSLPATFDAVDDAIDSNATIAEAILSLGLSSFGITPGDDSWNGFATPDDLDKARSTIRQFYRDWSAEGSSERSASYAPILAALQEHLPAGPVSQCHQYSILVPGAGLGRLVFDICAAGYTVEGNEISYHQLLASNYILNCTKSAGQHQLYPWALSFSNHLKRSSQLQAVAVPDVHPGSALENATESRESEVHYSERMSMTAGDFCELYKQADYDSSFDVVATCFFIDTAPNLINYIETIKHCLRPGGLWINLGPLLWHFESAPTPAERDKHRQTATSGSRDNQSEAHDGIGEPGSLELSDEEVAALVKRFGFEIVQAKQAPGGDTGYIQDPNSMLRNMYRPSFWVARLIAGSGRTDGSDA